MDRLREPRVRAILEPMLAGDLLGDVPEDDRRFIVDLGLLRRSAQGGLEVANPIYRDSGWGARSSSRPEGGAPGVVSRYRYDMNATY